MKYNKYFSSFVIGLFFLIFSLAVSLIFYLNFSYISKFEMAKNFIEVPAKLLSYELKQSRSSKGSVNYKIQAKYEYQINGQKFTSDQVQISSSSNNFTQKEQSAQIEYLEQAYQNGIVVVFVNPSNYNHSYIFRHLPVSEITFMNVFLIFPCFIGVLFMTSIPIYIKNLILKKNMKDPSYVKDTVDTFCGHLTYISFRHVS